MNKKLVLFGAAGLVLLTALLAAWGYKSIVVNIDGQSRSYRTWALTVGSALAAEGIALGPADGLQPSQEAFLKPGQVITIRRAQPVVLQADGKTVVLLSTGNQPKAWLDQARIKLAVGDVLTAGGQPVDPEKDSSIRAIQVRRQQDLRLEKDGTTTTLKSGALTIGEALWTAGIRLHSSDFITPTLGTILNPDMLIRLETARPVHVKLADGVHTLYSTAKTVGAALTEAGLALQGMDYTIPAETDEIPADGNIRLVRVTEQVVVHESPLPFKSTFAPVDTLELDSQKVVQPGVSGIEATRERIRYEDGVETSRQTDSQWVARLPQDRVVGYGTMVVRHTLKTPDGTITYWRALNMYATSYHPAETGGDITASGLQVEIGLAAVDTRYIPFYTQMYVPGYGRVMAADKGGGVVGRMIDLAYPDADYVPWHQWVTVYFLWPPPENIVYVFP